METLLMPDIDRRYALRRVFAFVIAVGLVVGVLGWALMISEHAALVFILIGVLATLFTTWQGIGMIRDGGVRETAEGITNRWALGHRRWRWGEIEEFKHVDSTVYLVTRDRHIWRLDGVGEGRRNIWEGGETRDITALLNDRLAAWRAQQAGIASADSHRDTAL
jgi:hypothetical protein